MAIAHPSAYCPTCKIAFPIPMGPEGGTFVFQNSTTNCPNGHFARILNAHYQTFEDEIQAKLRIYDQAVRKAVLALWERLTRQEMTPEQAREAAEKIKPGLGSIFNPANWSDPVKKAIIDVLITVSRTTGVERLIEPEHRETPPTIQQTVGINQSFPLPAPPQEAKESRKGGNRAFQRSQRHKMRVLMNPRSR